MSYKISLITASLLLIAPTITITPVWSADYQPLPIVYAKEYRQGIELGDYWQSEKLDGIRAIWDGQQLTTRNGYPIHAPSWFTEPLPSYPLEGELWAGREQFSLVQQTVLDRQPSDVAWQKINFMLFDVPEMEGDFRIRYQHLIEITTNIGAKHIQYIVHQPIESEQTLFVDLETLFTLGGEGLMLRRVAADYQAGRSDDLLKLKKHQDAEAQVIGYRPGKGKYTDMVGALIVRTDDGIEFAIGSGLTDRLRQSPPEIGCLITYQYNGYTDSGIPRFARFMRNREVVC